MNCKPGDLALVIRGRDAGKVVTVLSPVSADERIATSLGISLRIQLANLPAWHVDREMSVQVIQSGRLTTARVAADDDLIPLPPPASDESDTADQNLPAECVA